jgi:hypothetical protein
MYIRFVVEETGEDPRVRKGLVQAAYDLRDHAGIPDAEQRELRDALKWLEDNLPVPARFNRTMSKGFYRRRATALSWLKPTAHEHLAVLRRLGEIAARNGAVVSQLVSSRPGFVVHEDELQLIAEPFRDTPT